jgi:hypothetical protein
MGTLQAILMIVKSFCHKVSKNVAIHKLEHETDNLKVNKRNACYTMFSFIVGNVMCDVCLDKPKCLAISQFEGSATIISPLDFATNTQFLN